MTTNPYAPPRSDAGDALADGLSDPKSIPRRVSFLLAAIGFVGFWGGAMLLAASDAEGANDSKEIVLGVVVMLAIAAHIAGIALVFGVPRGRRWLPALLNGVSLAIMVALVFLGLMVAGVE